MAGFEARPAPRRCGAACGLAGSFRGPRRPTCCPWGPRPIISGRPALPACLSFSCDVYTSVYVICDRWPRAVFQARLKLEIQIDRGPLATSWFPIRNKERASLALLPEVLHVVRKYFHASNGGLAWLSPRLYFHRHRRGDRQGRSFITDESGSLFTTRKIVGTYGGQAVLGRSSRLHGLETNRAIQAFPGKECVHQQHRCERADSLNGCLHVFPLLRLHFQGRYVQPLGIERTVLMGNQHHTLKTMHLDQETQLLDHAFFFPEGKEVTGEAASPSRHRETVVARESQGVVQEIVEVLAKSPVAAIDGGSADAVRVEGSRTLIGGAIFSVVHGCKLIAMGEVTISAQADPILPGFVIHPVLAVPSQSYTSAMPAGAASSTSQSGVTRSQRRAGFGATGRGSTTLMPSCSSPPGWDRPIP